MDNELDIAKRYGLFWALSLVTEDDGTPIADGTYIYQPERFSETFWVLFEKLQQLNDYCFLQLVTVEQHHSKLVDQRESYMADSGPGAEALYWLDDQIPRWEDNLTVVTQATSIVLLCSFVEWGLKRVVKDLYGAIARKPSGSRVSDIQFLLEHLEASGLSYVVDAQVLHTVHSFRGIRNAFAHGEWAAIEEQLANVSLRDCFENVSQLFACLEAASWEGPWRSDVLSSSKPPAP